MRRRELLKGMGLAAVAAVAGAPASWAGKRLEWRMATAWSRDMDVFWPGMERFASRVNELTAGTLRITPLPAGELAGPLEVFDAVAEGRAEMGHSSAYYWADRIPAAQWFSSVPFGMDKNGLNAWLYDGEGLRFWEQAYAPFGVRPLSMGDSGAQMFGWFRRALNNFSDLQGLSLRFPGLAGKVLERAGARVVMLPGQELREAFASGALDGVNWIGPHHDLQLGLAGAGTWYYGPGWQEPSGRLEALVSVAALEKLDASQRAALKAAAAEVDLWMQARFDALNAGSLHKLHGLAGVHVASLPEAFLNRAWTLSREVLLEAASADSLSTRIHEDYARSWERCQTWNAFSALNI
ncbi:MAG: TRAP transporter substrate-binding protein [Desulfovibrio sp.]